MISAIDWTVVGAGAAIVAAVAAIVGVIFGFGPWKEWRGRLDLSLHSLGHGGLNMSGEDREVDFRLELRNQGHGMARSWKVELRSPIGLHEIVMRDPPPAPGFLSYAEGSTRVIRWQSPDEGAVIPSGHGREQFFKTKFKAGQEVSGDFTIYALRMKPKAGRIKVAWEPDHHEPRIWLE